MQILAVVDICSRTTIPSLQIDLEILDNNLASEDNGLYATRG